MYKGETFQGLLDYWGENQPDREAVFDGLRRISYSELREESESLAITLSQMHIQKGDKVLVFLPNWHEFIILFFAVAKIGAILIPANVVLVEKEVNYGIGRVRPRIIFVASKKQFAFLEPYKESCAIVTVRFEEAGYLSFTKLVEKGRNGQAEEIQVYPEDEFTIVFTSGSTGYPKGVELTYRNLFQSAKNVGYRLNCTNEETFLVALPCCHVFCLVIGILTPLFFGGKIVFMEKFNPLDALELIEQETVTVNLGVPTMYIRELQELKNNQKNISSLRTGIVAGAICPENTIQQIQQDLHCDVLIAYGSTETVAVSMTSFADEMVKRCQTVGRPFDGVEVKVINKDGDLAKIWEVGELFYKGYGLMKGYYGMPDKYIELVDKNGWYHTGDLASMDESGYIKIVGRKNDMIIRGGYSIYPSEVEEVYFKYPAVLDICVLGIPHQILGEQTYAFIQLRDNDEETTESLREYANGRIAKYKIPDKVILVNKIPKLENGKTDKQVLKDIFFRLEES